MSLHFAASTERSSHPGASVDDLDSPTYIFWTLPRQVNSANSYLVRKGGGLSMKVGNNGGQGRIDYNRARGTTATDVVSATDTLVVDQWNFFAVADSDGTAPQIFWGDLTTAVAEVSYATQTTGVGSVPGDSSHDMHIGSRDSANVHSDHEVGICWVYNRRLTAAEIALHQFAPWLVLPGCALKVHFGYNGTGDQIDWSGNANHGTLTATPDLTPAPPLGHSFWFPTILTPPTVSTGAQTITPSGIASAEALGTAQLNQAVVASGIATAEAFGTAQLNLTIAVTAIASAEAFGTAQLNLAILPSAIATAEALGSPTVAGPIEAVGNIASAEAFGSPQLNLQVAPAGIATAEAFGAAQLNLAVAVTGIGTAEAFGTAQLNQQIAPSAVASAEAFGSATVSLAGGGPQTITATGIASAEAFGTAQLNQQIAPSGIASAEAFGSAQADQQIAPSALASAEAFGTAVVAGPVIVTGIASAEAFGTTTLSIGGQTITATGIASAEAFGTPAVTLAIAPVGIASTETFGTAILAGPVLVHAIGTTEAFGTPRVCQGTPTLDDVEVLDGDYALVAGAYVGTVTLPALDLSTDACRWWSVRVDHRIEDTATTLADLSSLVAGDGETRWRLVEGRAASAAAPGGDLDHTTADLDSLGILADDANGWTTAGPPGSYGSHALVRVWVRFYVGGAWEDWVEGPWVGEYTAQQIQVKVELLRETLDWQARAGRIAVAAAA